MAGIDPDTVSDTATPTPTKKGNLLASSLVFSLMTMISRVAGLVRDVVVATTFGAGSVADAFFVAFKIPNLLRRLFAEGAFSQAFVPVLSEYRSKYGHAQVKSLVDHVTGTLGLVTGLVTLAGMAAAPLVVMLFAPGFSEIPEKMALAGDLLRITFPYIFFISLTGLAGGVLNSYGRFASASFTPVLLNISLIVAALFVAPMMAVPVHALAWGVFVAGAVQLAFQMPFLARIQMLPRPRLKRNHPGVTRIMRLMVPALFGVSVVQLGLLINTVLASLLEDGSVSWLYYSDRLTELPLGVFGVALSTVVLPALSRAFAGEDVEGYRTTMSWALRMVCLIGLPALVALEVLAKPLLTTIFQYGEMTPMDVEMASLSLRAYALGLLTFMLVKVLASGYYARQEIRIPVKIGIYAMLFGIVMNFVLIVPLKHTGLALATALASVVNAGLLYRGLHRRGIFRLRRDDGSFFLRVALSTTAMALTIWWLCPPADQWFQWGWQDRVLSMGGLVLVGLGVYVVAAMLTGIRPGAIRPPA
jgi:putative peptidoglycan lipid II flippase